MRYHSGPGSLASVTTGYEAFVADHIERSPHIETLVDIGCGDFQVSRRILQRVQRPIRYIGCDLVRAVVDYNQAALGVPGEIEFIVCNAATDVIPSGDLVTVREVFQPLSNDMILKVLAQLRRRFSEAIITESIFTNPRAPNLDIVSGYRTRDGLQSGVYLERAPFNLTVIDDYAIDTAPGEQIRSLRVRL